MSAIEFTANAGKTFSVQLYDANTGAAVGSAITGVTDSVTPTRYRNGTGSNSGIVFVLATATNLSVSGYADLDNPNEYGYSELGSLSDIQSAGLQSIEAGIAEILVKIQTGVISIVSPVNQDGSLNPLVIGDDYLAANSRSIDLFIDPIDGVSAETVTCTFGGMAQHRGDWLVSGTVTAVTIDGNPKWRLRFELDAADTIDCKPGCYAWSATVLSSAGKRITRITGEVALVASQTIE